MFDSFREPVVAQIVGQIIGAGFNYLTYRVLVFRGSRSTLRA